MTTVSAHESLSGVTKAVRPTAPRRSFSSRLFGYDIFLSFALGPPPRGTHSYASDLARRLQERDFTVFFSEEEIPPGEQLDSALQQALLRSKALVVIANRGTLQEPRWVRKEVEEYRERHPYRPVIPINVDGALQDSAINENSKEWLDYRGKVWIDESQEAVETGIASERVVERLATAPRRSRTNVRWRWVTRVVVALLSVLLVVAAMAAWLARSNAKKAELQTKIALANAEKAKLQARIAESQRIKSLAQYLAAESRINLEENPQRSLLLAIEAIKTADVTTAHEAIREAIAGTSGTALGGHAGRVQAVAFGPNQEVFASGGADGTVRIWNVDDPEKTLHILSGHKDEVWALAFSPDGQILASGSRDRTIRLWSLEEPNSSPKVLSAHQGYVGDIAFRPDGRVLASVGGDNAIRLWSLDDLGKAPRTLKGQKSASWAVAFSHDGRQIASGGRDGIVRVWNADRIDLEPTELRGHGHEVFALAFHQKSPRLISAGTSEVFLWDLTDLETPPQSLPGNIGGYVDISLSPDGNQLVSASNSNNVLVWDLRSPERTPTRLHGHDGIIRAVAYSPDGSKLVSGSSDSTLRLWSMPPASAVSEPKVLNASSGVLFRLAFSPDGELIAVAGYSGPARVWRVNELNAKPQLFGPGSGPVDNVAFAPVSGMLATLSRNGTAYLWDTSDSRTPRKTVTNVNRCIAFSHDGSSLATDGRDGIVRLWSLVQLDTKPTELPTLPDNVTVSSLAFSPDGRWLALGGHTNNLYLWDLKKNALNYRPLASPTSGIWDISFSSDGRHLAAGTQKGTVEVWNLQNLDSKPKLLRGGHDDIVYGVSFNPDGTLLASAGGNDNMVRLWKLRDPDAQPITLRGHSSLVYDVSFTPDGSLLGSASYDGTVRLWTLNNQILVNLACERAGRGLTATEKIRYFGDVNYSGSCGK